MDDNTLSIIRDAVAGDVHAWQQLIESVAQQLSTLARANRSLRAKGLVNQDDVNEVVTLTLERLRKNNFRNLRQFLEQCDRAETEAGRSFDAWLYGAVNLTVREHMRQRYGRAPARSSEPANAPERVLLSKRDVGSTAGRLTELDEQSGQVLPEITTRLTLAEILTAIQEDFSAEEALAVRMYYGEELSYSELAGRLELVSADAAEKLIRRLKARLRYRFSSPP